VPALAPVGICLEEKDAILGIHQNGTHRLAYGRSRDR
jgi:hypothetical protein